MVFGEQLNIFTGKPDYKFRLNDFGLPKPFIGSRDYEKRNEGYHKATHRGMILRAYHLFPYIAIGIGLATCLERLIK